MFRSRGFLICSDNLLMFVLSVPKCWLPNQTAWLGQKRCWHVQRPGWFGSYSQPPFLSQKENISVWYLLLSRGCLQKSQRPSQCCRFILIENIKESSCWFIQKSSHEIPQMIYSSSLGVLGLSAFYPPRCLQSVCWPIRFTITAEIVFQLFKKEWPLSYLHPWYFLDSHLVNSTWLCLM